MSSRLSPLLALLALGGCAGQPVISTTELSPTYQVVELTASAAKTPVGVVVRGHPFGMDDQAMAKQVTGMIPTSTPVGGRLAAASGTTEAAEYQLVFDFAPPSNRSAGALCRATPSNSAQPLSGDRVTVFGALCVGHSPVNWAVGYTEMAANQDAPAFRNLISQISFKLMPLFNPDNPNLD